MGAVGRAHDLVMLQGRLEDKHNAIVTGMPGVGKSTLVSLFVDRYGARYPGGVLWAELGYAFRDAAQCRPVLNSWACWAYGGDVQILRDAGLRFEPTTVRALLSGHGPLLVVLDDVWSLEAIEPLRRALPIDSHMVATARDVRIAETIDPLPLDVLVIDDALLLLRASLPNISDAPLARLAYGLGRHAQALAIAAGDIKRRGSRERCEQAIDILLAHVQSGQGFGDLPQLDQCDRPSAVEVTLKFSYDDIGASATMGANHQRRFRALGALGPLEGTFNTTLAAALWDDEVSTAAEFLDVLRDRSLVKQVADDLWVLHTLVQGYTRALLSREKELEPFGRYLNFVIEAAREGFRRPPQEWVQFVSDLPHIHYIGGFLVRDLSAVLGDLQLLASPSLPQRVDVVALDESERNVVGAAIAFSSAVLPYVAHRPEIGGEGREWLAMGLASVRALNDQPRTGLLLRDLAIWHYEHGQPNIALAYSEQALSVARDIGDKTSEASVLNNIAGIYRDTGQPQRALELFEQALSITHEAHDKAGEAMTLGNMALVYQALGQPQRALELSNQVLSIARDMGGRVGEATTLSNMGMAYRALGQPQRALELYEQALPIRREVSDRAGEAATLNNMGLAHSALGQPQRALELYNQALPLMREVSDRGGEAATLLNLGQTQQVLGQHLLALELYNQALSVAHSADRWAMETAALNFMGEIYRDIAQPERALTLFEEALVITRGLGDRLGEATALGRIGTVYQNLGQLEQALELYGQALATWRDLGDRKNEAATLHNMGTAFQALGQSEQALELLERALTIMHEDGRQVGEAATLAYMGEIYRHEGQPGHALQMYNQALPILRDVGDRTSEATTLNNKGLAYLALVQVELALDALRQSLSIRNEVNDQMGKVATLHNIGEIYQAIGQPQLASEMREQAEAIRLGLKDMPVGGPRFISEI